MPDEVIDTAQDEEGIYNAPFVKSDEEFDGLAQDVGAVVMIECDCGSSYFSDNFCPNSDCRFNVCNG